MEKYKVLKYKKNCFVPLPVEAPVGGGGAQLPHKYYFISQTKLAEKTANYFFLFFTLQFQN